MQNFINNKLAALQTWATENGAEREEGQGTVEYAVVLGVLVVAIYTAFTTSNIAGGVTRAVSAIVAVMPT